MYIFSVLLLVVLLQSRTIRWYSFSNMGHDVSFAQQYGNMMTGWYPLETAEHGIIVHVNGSVSVPTSDGYGDYRKMVKALRYSIPNRTLTIHAVSGNWPLKVLMSYSLHKAIPAIVKHVKDSTLDGYIIDAEPHDYNISTGEILVKYSAFLHALALAMHAEGLELGFDVANFGPISVNRDYFNLYALGSIIDFFTSMSPTYFGSNITNNEIFSSKLKKVAGRDRTRIGMGTMEDAASTAPCTWNYNWTQTRFETFTTWLKVNEFDHIDIWPCNNGSHTINPSWYMNALANFLEA